MKPKTPQEKKALSYTKDRRNWYGENDKSSRKSIKKRKDGTNRVFRRAVNQVLQDGAVGIKSEEAELLDGKIGSVKRRVWKKLADMPLGEFVKRHIEKRQRSYRAKIKRREDLEKRKSNVDN